MKRFALLLSVLWLATRPDTSATKAETRGQA